jgi:branched-chain amino acid transport system permease protein
MFWIKRGASILIGLGVCFLIQTLALGHLGDYQQRLLVLAGLYVTLAVSLNLINGITGQFSIGHAAFYQIGAYTAGYISKRYITDLHHTPPPTPWIFGMLVIGAGFAALAGFLVGLPSLRLKGDYLAIVTLGFGEIVRIIVQNTDAVGGPYALDGIPKIQPIWLVYALAFTCIAVCRNLLKTARGLTFLAVREDEIASQAMGVNVTSVKVTAFVLGSAFAGAAGVLLAHYEGVTTPTTFSMDVSFIILTMVVLGGTGSITGSIVAAAFLFYLPEYLRDRKTASGEALAFSGANIVAALVVTALVVVCIKKVTDGHWRFKIPKPVSIIGFIVGGGVALPMISALLHVYKPLAEKQVPTDQLRMVIFAVCLIVIMLVRPQGIFAHHEFSWTWVKKLFGGGNLPTPEVAA